MQNRTKRRSIFRWAKLHSCDVLFLQETHSTSEIEHIWRNEWYGTIVYSHGSSNSKGTAILFRKNLKIKDLDVLYKSPDGRIVFVKVEIEQRIHYLLNLYSPNVLNSQIQFYNQIKGLLVKYTKMDDTIVMGGDYNIILDENLDKKDGITEKKEKVVDIINKTIQNFDLIDIWRLRNPDIKQFTWRQKMKK